MTVHASTDFSMSFDPGHEFEDVQMQLYGFGDLQTAVTILAADRQSDRPVSERETIEGETILENIYQRLEANELNLVQANCLQASLKSQYERSRSRAKAPLLSKESAKRRRPPPKLSRFAHAQLA